MPKQQEPYFEAMSETQANPDLSRLARRYDLSAISPRGMVELSSELFTSGYLTDAQYVELSFQSELMPNFDITIGALTGEQAEPDRPRNYADIWRQRLEFEKNHAADDKRILARTQKILDLLQSIENQPTNSQALTTITQINKLNKNWEDTKKAAPIKLPLKLPPLSLG